MDAYQSRIKELQDFFDFWDRILLFGMILIMGLPLFPPVISMGDYSVSIPQYPVSPIAAFTAFYVFFAFKKMRKDDINHQNTQTVRPDYKNNEENDFGLRNFGPGPALNLRVYARITPDGPDLVVPESEYPLHLKEVEFMSLLRRDFAELGTGGSKLYDRPTTKKTELYYTWESESGIQCPTSLDGPREMKIDELVDEAEDPRTVPLKDLRKNFAKRSQIVEEPTL